MSVKRNKKDGYYIIKGCVYINGKAHYYDRHDTKDTRFKNKEWCKDEEKKIREKILLKFKEDYNGEILSSLFEKYANFKAINYAKRTSDKINYSFKKYLFSFFNPTEKIYNIFSVKNFYEFYSYLGKKQLTTNHKNNILYYLKDLTNYARRNDYIDGNLKEKLIDLLEPYSERTSEIHKRKEEIHKYTSPTDAQKIFNACEFPRSHVFRLFYYSGCRISEFLAIALKDIIYEKDRAFFDINKQVDHAKKGLLNKDLKTASSYRLVPLSKENTIILKDYLSRVKFDKNDLIFNFSKNNFRYHLDNAFEKTGIEHNTLHGFGRKSIATYIFNETGNVKYAQLLLGHKNADTTLNIYVEKNSSKRKLLDFLDDIEDINVEK